jgi:hypothetical protein
MPVHAFRAPRLAPLVLCLAAAAGGARADVVVPDDEIVQGSLCVGLDCILNESFGFDTVRLKNDVIRLGFFDTSSSPGFPTTDWRIAINDADGEGSGQFFAIDNADSGARILRLDANAPANSLFVDSVGRLGLGTTAPAKELHAVSRDTPGLRLQQDAAGGNSAMIWDVAGNEANFFVRDLTNGSQLAFRIMPGAPTNTLALSALGNVGIGIQNGNAPLHLRREDGSARLRVEEASGTAAPRTLLELVNNGPAMLQMNDTGAGTAWNLAGDATLTLARTGAGTPQFALAPNGDLTITGTLSQGSSRLLKTAIEAVDAPAVLARVLELPVFEWSYLGRPASERHLGPMAEDFHAAFGLGGDPARLAPSDVAGVALVAVQELAQQVEQRKRDIAEIRARIDALEARQP